MKRTIALPFGVLEVWQHQGGDTVIEVGYTGNLHVKIVLPPYAAGKLADAIEDVNTNRVTLEEATALTATTGGEMKTVWGVWEHFGGDNPALEGPDLKTIWDTEEEAFAEMNRLNQGATPGHVYYSIKSFRQPKL